MAGKVGDECLAQKFPFPGRCLVGIDPRVVLRYAAFPEAFSRAV